MEIKKVTDDIVMEFKSDGSSEIAGTLKTGGYKSSDGSAGITTTFLDQDGNTITIKNGLVTAKTAP